MHPPLKTMQIQKCGGRARKEYKDESAPTDKEGIRKYKNKMSARKHRQKKEDTIKSLQEENEIFKRRQNRMQQRICEYENAFKKVMDISSYNINENAAMQIMDFMKKAFPSKYQLGGYQQNGNNPYYPSSTTMLKPSNENAEKFHSQFRRFHPHQQPQKQQPQQMIPQSYCNYSSSFLPPHATMLTPSNGNAVNIGAQLQYPQHQQQQQQLEFPHSNELSMSKLNLNGDTCNAPSIENEMSFVSSVALTAVEQNVFDDEIPPKRPEILTPYQCSGSPPPPKQPHESFENYSPYH